MRRHILHRRLPPGLLVPPVVVKHHIGPQKPGDQASAGAKDGRGDERRLVLGLFVLAEDVARHETHYVGERHANGRQDHAAALVGNVVVVPCREEDRGCRGAPYHHEAGVVGELDLALDVVDGSVDDEADKGEGEAEHDEGEPDAQKVGAEGEDEQHNGAANVGRDRVEVRLDEPVAEALDDLGHEEGDGLDGHTEADLDEEEAVGGRMAEDAERIAQVKLFSDD